MKNFRPFCMIGFGAVLLAMFSCVPAPERTQTQVVPADATQITMTKNGRAEIKKVTAEEESESENSKSEN